MDNLFSTPNIFHNLTKKNQLLQDNKTEEKRNASGLTATEQSTEIINQRQRNSYDPQSEWDIHKLTYMYMDNPPTNSNFHDEHGQP